MAPKRRFDRFRLPENLTQRWRARLRAQRTWWRRRWRATAGDDVLFPAAGGGMVAVETLARGGARPGPRIAILHATAGSGHKRAAQALAVSLARLDPAAIVEDVDTLVFASRLYRGSYASGYHVLAARAPAVWGALYRSWELAPLKRGAGAVRLMDRLNLRRLARVVERERPDAIVCTHFLPVEALSPIRGRGELRVPLYCVITDFAAHPFWAFPHVDRYFVASDAVKTELEGHGIARERIEVTGIPIDPRFAERVGRDEARRRLGIDSRRPMVLVMGGGSGVGPLGELAERLAALAVRPQVWVACGTNRGLKSRIESLPSVTTGDVHAIGFTQDIDLLLEACDVLVSKAGGLTCAEALVKHVPLVVFRPTPGQEVRNAEYLEEAGAAVHADTVDEVASTVGRWLTDREERARVCAAAARLARPDAARVIAERVLAAVGSGARADVA
jgi:processive 1,2-diacylglycerol beta-glucosyltransferase